MQNQAERIARVVRQTRQRLRRHLLLTGLGWLTGLVLGWFVLVVTVDMLVPMTVPMRVAAWGGFWLLLAALLIVAVLRPLLRPPATQDVAFRIERSIPQMHNRLVTVLDLQRRNGDTAHRDEAFVQRLLEQTQQRLESFRFEQVVNPRPLRLATLTAAGVVAIGLTLLGFNSERMPTAMARIMRPTAPIAPISWVRIRAVPGDMQVLQGEPAMIRAVFDRGHTDGLGIRVRAGDGPWNLYPMVASPDGASFGISAVNTPHEYQILGGGTWTPVHRVTMIHRPIIEQLQTVVRLPEYMLKPAPLPLDDRATQISTPVGSTIELAASVSGDPRRGQVQLFKTVTTTTEVAREQELVWFDDDLPAGAAATGAWRWSAEQVYSGARAHTFNWSRQPYGLTTRLSKLTVEPASRFFVYVYLDPRDTPSRFVVHVHANDQEVALAWGEAKGEAKAEPATGKARVVEMGPLPDTGRWVRLDAGTDKLLGSAAQASVGGLTFATDKGRLYFDRVGSVEERKESVSTTTLEPTEVLPMSRDKEAWVGRVAVGGDFHYAVQFFNGRDDPSPPMKPMPVVATVDQPPAILVEKPGKSIVLPELEPVPLMVRAFDDYGVDRVGVQGGATADALGEVRWIARFDKPEQNHLVLTSIDPEGMALQPGGAVYYRLVVRDRKGQESQSETFRLGLAAADAAQAAGVEKAAPALAPLLEGLASLVELQGDVVSSAAKVIGDLPAHIKARPAEYRVQRLVKSDGTPMTPEEIEKFRQERAAALDEENKAALAELDREFMHQRERALRFAQQLEAAADEAGASSLVLNAEPEALRALAQRVREVASMEPDRAFEEAAELGRMMELQELTADQRAQLIELQRQLAAMVAARAMLADAPEQAQAAMRSVASEVDASRALQHMGYLATNLEQQRQVLDDLRNELAALRREAASAHASEMDAISAAQNNFDDEALASMAAARDLMREQMAGQTADPDDAPPAPWAPPGERIEALPTEQDTPDKDAATADAAEDAADPEAPPERDENWWEKPVDSPPTAATIEDDPRYAGRDQRPVEADPQPPSKTPRQMLADHQQQMERHLGSRQSEVAAAQQQVSALSQSMRQSINDMRNASPQQAAAMAAELRQLMASEATRRAMAAGQRAAMESAMRRQAMRGQNAQPGGDGASPMPGSAPPPMVVNIDIGGIDFAGQAEAIYRLPPRLREPLIQGMRERGPDAYQPLIDAYYRTLSKDVK